MKYISCLSKIFKPFIENNKTELEWKLLVYAVSCVATKLKISGLATDHKYAYLCICYSLWKYI